MKASLEIVARLNDILPNPGCVYEALESILESCQTPERLDERTWLGIRLSICEFQAANIKYPAVCAERSGLSACTQLLESKPTWWTTFSGNYRHISAICLEYQPHFESQKVLGTFKDASQLFAEYQTEIDYLLRDHQKQKSGYMKAWQEQADELARNLAEVVGGLHNLNQVLQNTKNSTEAILAPLEAAFGTMEARLHQAVASSQLVANQTLQLSQQAVAFNAVMVDVESRHIQATERLQTAVNYTVVSLDREIRSLQRVLGGLKAVVGALGLLLRFCMPFAVLLFVIAGIYLLRRLQRRPIITDTVSIDESDPIFY